MDLDGFGYGFGPKMVQILGVNPIWASGFRFGLDPVNRINMI